MLAVATAVIQYLVDRADLLENVRGWLKRDPASLAYQRALLRAYAAFARSDPVLAKSFFDETFLARPAVPELAKQLTRHEHANGGELARLWATTLYPDMFAEKRAQWATDERVVQSCAQFLEWLENELKREEVFQPLFDSRALESLEARFDELVRVLTIQRNEALRGAEVYEPIINQIVQQGGIVISGNANVVVYGDMVGGDVHREVRRRTLYERYAALEVADHVEKLVGEYSKLFVGRDAEVARLDSFLTQKSSGMIVVTAKAGFGKTALLANWVSTRQGRNSFIAYHFFSHIYETTHSVINAYRNLLRQLYIYHELAENIPNDENELHGALSGIIQERGARSDEPLVFVIDGLDEADKGFDLPFPSHLPDGVFIIASVRPDERKETKYLRNWLATAERLQLSRLSDMAIGDYLRHADDGKLAQYVQDPSFVAEVAEKTEGYPLYLRYLSDDMIAAKTGQDVHATLTRSPRGFSAYVDTQIDLIAETVDLKPQAGELFSILSVALGTLSADDLQRLTGLTTFGLRSLPWRVTRWFSIQSSPDSPELYSFAHPMLADEFGRALGRQAQQAREKLIEYCRSTWREGNTYALIYLPTHLIQVGAIDDLHSLINEDFMWAKRSKFGSHRGFALDLEQAIETLQKSRLEDLPRRIAYTLLYATLGSLSANITPRVLSILVQLGQVDRAVSYAEMMVDRKQRAEAFRTIAGGGDALFGHWWQSDVRLDSTFLKRAVDEAWQIPDTEKRLKFVAQIAPELARSGDAEAALEAAERLYTEWPDGFTSWARDFMVKIPVELARIGKAKEAVNAAEFINEKFRQANDLGKIEDVLRRTQIFGGVAVHLAIAGKVLDAIELAVSIDAAKDNLWKELGREDPFGEDKNRVVRDVAHNIGIKEEWLVQALGNASRIEDLELRMKAYRSIVMQIEDVRAWQIEDLRRRFGLNYSREFLSSLETKVSQLVWLGEVDKVLELLKENYHVHLEPQVANQLIYDLLLSGRDAEAKEVTDSVGLFTQKDQIERWEKHAAPLLEQIRRGQEREVIERLRDGIDSMVSWRIVEALVMIAPILIERGYIEEIIRIFQGPRKYDLFVSAADLASHLARKGHLVEAQMFIAQVLDYEDALIPQAFYDATGPLARDGKFNEIIWVAQSFVKDVSVRCELLTQVALRLVNVNKQEAVKILEEALAESENLESSSRDLSDAFAAMAEELLNAGRVENALSIADEIWQSATGVWAEVLVAYLADLTATDMENAERVFNHVLAELGKLGEPDIDSYVLARAELDLTCALCKQKRFEWAIKAQNLIENDSRSKSQAQALIAAGLARADVARAQDFLQLAWSGSQKETELGARDLVEALIEANWLDGAMIVAQMSQDDSLVRAVQFYVILNSPGPDQGAKAETLIAESELPEEKAQFAKGFITKFLEAGKPELASAVFLTVREILIDEEVSIWTEIALKFAKSAQFSQAEQAIVNIKQTSERLRAQHGLIRQLVESGNFAVARTIAQGVEDTKWRNYLENFAEAKNQIKSSSNANKVHAELVQRTSQKLNNIEAETLKSWLLINTASDFVVTGQLPDLMNWVKGIQRYEPRQQTSTEIALQLASAGLVEQALFVCDTIDDSQRRSWTLRRILTELKHLKLEEATEGIGLVLDKVRMGSREETCRLMSYVIPVIGDLAGPTRGAEFAWQTYEEIQKSEKMWQRN